MDGYLYWTILNAAYEFAKKNPIDEAKTAETSLSREATITHCNPSLW